MALGCGPKGRLSQLIKHASCRLNSSEHGELCEKLRAPIRSAANVVIRQSLGDLFLETFASLVEVNPAYSAPSNQVRAGPSGSGWSSSQDLLVRLSVTPFVSTTSL